MSRFGRNFGRFAPLAAVAGLAIALSACGGGGALPTPAPATAAPSSSPLVQPSTAPSEAPTSAASATPQSGGGAPTDAVTTLQAVKGATIQIESEGTFIDPEVGQMNNAAGRGSGFFIDPSGLAITNNHVVTGSAFLKIWVGGDKENVRNARILGASECSDLALIQVLGVDQVPFLGWYSGPIDAGLDVYAAGFPLGDPEYALKKGIVSKAKANGDTTWASIESVIEHDAAMLPGNSGGPLVTPDGKVVGVNFASDQAGERFAVSQAEVLRILPELKTGKDVTSIGVNGQAVNDEASGISGIWVSSVKSGSPADQAGVKPGDIITRLENLVLSTDGTMGDYCRILRGHNPGDVLSIEVLRFSTKEILEGQLNGRVLTKVTSFGDEGGGGGDGADAGAVVARWRRRRTAGRVRGRNGRYRRHLRRGAEDVEGAQERHHLGLRGRGKLGHLARGCAEHQEVPGDVGQPRPLHRRVAQHGRHVRQRRHHPRQERLVRGLQAGRSLRLRRRRVHRAL